MFGWKRRNDVQIALLLERVIEGLDTVVHQNKKINEGMRTIMATQADFNAKVAQLDGILDVFAAGYAAQKQIIANVTAERDRLRDQAIDTSALDAVLEEARGVQAAIDPALDPAQPTPPASDIPVVTPVDGAEQVETPAAPTVDTIVGADDTVTPETSETPAEDVVDAPVVDDAPVTDAPATDTPVTDTPAADSGSSSSDGGSSSSDGGSASV